MLNDLKTRAKEVLRPSHPQCLGREQLLVLAFEIQLLKERRLVEAVFLNQFTGGGVDLGGPWEAEGACFYYRGATLNE